MLEFKQKPFLKPYIKRNTDLRRETEKEGSKIKKNTKLRNNVISDKRKNNFIMEQKLMKKKNGEEISINHFILIQAY